MCVPFTDFLFLTGLWAVVNNAGMSTFGEVEFTSMDTYKQVSEVNLWGTIRVTKAVLPLIRRAKGQQMENNTVYYILNICGEVKQCPMNARDLSVTCIMKLKISKGLYEEWQQCKQAWNLKTSCDMKLLTVAFTFVHRWTNHISRTAALCIVVN